MLDPHSRLCDACPFAVFVAELSEHIGLLACLIAFLAVFFPEQCNGYARFSQFTTNVLVVGFNTHADIFVLVREEQQLQVSVSDIGIQWPLNPLFESLVYYRSNCVIMVPLSRPILKKLS